MAVHVASAHEERQVERTLVGAEALGTVPATAMQKRSDAASTTVLRLLPRLTDEASQFGLLLPPWRRRARQEVRAWPPVQTRPPSMFSVELRVRVRAQAQAQAHVQVQVQAQQS